MKYLCLDPGLRHTGVAVSHEGILATPLTTVDTADLSVLLKKITLLCDVYRIDILVIGQPESGPLHSYANLLKISLLDFLHIPIHLFPEDLSSLIGIKKLARGGMAKEKRESTRHSAAAAIILGDYLDSLQSL